MVFNNKRWWSAGIEVLVRRDRGCGLWFEVAVCGDRGCGM